MMNEKEQKLNLDKETIIQLSEDEMENVNGGILKGESLFNTVCDMCNETKLEI